jgi:hypothetical protein
MRLARLGRTLDAYGIGHVAEDAPDPWPKRAQAVDGRGQRSGLDVGEHDVHARIGQGAAERKSDAARPARHEGRLAGELLHHHSLLSRADLSGWFERSRVRARVMARCRAAAPARVSLA